MSNLTPVGDDPPPDGEVPSYVDLDSLPAWEQHIWRTPGLSVQQRQMAILLVRLDRGDLFEAVDEAETDWMAY